MKLGITGSTSWQSKRKIERMMNNIRYMDTLIVLGGGSIYGADPIIKHYALDFELPYREYNPSFSGHNMHSALPPSYYNKKYHFSQLLHRMTLLVNDCDKLIIFKKGNTDPAIEAAIKRVQKLKKPYVIIV